MSKRALTAAAVEQLKPPATGQADHFDAGYPGLALRLSYAGGRSWTFHYRVHGKQRRLRPRHLPCHVARRGAGGLAHRSARGRGRPRPGHREGRGEASAARHRAGGGRAVHREVAPAAEPDGGRSSAACSSGTSIPKSAIATSATVTRRDILDMLDKAEERGAKVAVNRVLANVRRLFRWAVERGIIEASPVAAVKAPAPETARDRVLTDDELRAFLRACDSASASRFGPLFRLLLLTGQRRDEVAAAPWAEFDLDAALWKLPAARTKNKRAHQLPLSAQAVEVIRALPVGSKLLFPAKFTRPVRAGETAKPAESAARPVSGFGRAKVRLELSSRTRASTLFQRLPSIGCSRRMTSSPARPTSSSRPRRSSRTRPWLPRAGHPHQRRFFREVG